MRHEANHRNATGEPARDSRGLADRLRRVGQRVTPQRLVILGALRPGAHLSADDLFTRVEPLLPGVNRSTVYRTLELSAIWGWSARPISAGAPVSSS